MIFAACSNIYACLLLCLILFARVCYAHPATCEMELTDSDGMEGGVADSLR